MHQLHQLPAYHQSQPCAVPTLVGIVGLIERLEQLFLTLLGDAHTAVTHHKLQPYLLALNDDRLHTKADNPAFGIFERVTQQIADHLLQTYRVTVHLGRGVRLDRGHKIHRLVRTGAKRRHSLFDHFAKIKRLVYQRHFPGLDFGKVENVINHRQQRLAGTLDDLGIGGLHIVELGTPQQIHHTDDTVKRCTDLVTHTGQKLTFELTGFLRGLFFLAQSLDTFDLSDILHHADDTAGPVRPRQGLANQSIPARLAVALPKAAVFHLA